MSQISSQNILLRGGTLLIHDVRGHVVSEVLDLLIEGSTISKIEKSIQLTDAEARNTRILSCEGKVISPGFINTHQHLFQTQIKGKVADCNLAKFFTCANTFAANYDAKDAFWGQLCGALENVDAGTTTVVDHGNPNLAEHSGALAQALAVSGLRTIFCYSPGVQHDYTSPHALSKFQQLAAEVRNGNGRVTMGYAMDNIFLPQDILTAHYRAIRAAGAKLITTHGASGPPFGNRPSALQLLHQHALLGPDVLVSHANYPKEHDSALLRATGASVSTTPSIELQTGLSPVALMPEFCNHSSLGTDGNGWSTAYMPVEMGMLLQHARWSRAQDLAREGKWSASVGPKVEEVFNLATTAGAKAVGMADEVGRLAVGFKADILVFDGNSPDGYY
ncbi:5-methylthioadenosine/S-adenosylhomocysteine deaminase [Lasiodiplodia hormozganensis]|uniref:5-methylthioadenosine/S-adenosylhomocysteine deaminase n=1 Tax=Lasiodiplodia hormozganensis TaxID=869390 RepID=A0AA39WNP6_9PEZI|nr:5-methylthioadenosine/S-adenosylhomocysteine deaminase [Lasiodiplodia hormozganensis]